MEARTEEDNDGKLKILSLSIFRIHQMHRVFLHLNSDRLLTSVAD